MVCAIASDNAIKISNPTESFKIQTKAVVWPAKIKVIQDYNIRLNEKNIYRTRAIITRGLYIFYPIFTAVYIVERFVMQSG